jgi:hypothetical protein
MKDAGCAAVRRQLHAFHDGELTVSEQIAVGSHLERCAGCATLCTELRQIRSALRATARPAGPWANDEAASFREAIINRARAEQTLALPVRMRQMFEDMHLVYAGIGSVVAALVSVAVMLGMMRFATSANPESLAALVNLLAPGSNRNPIRADAFLQLPRALDQAFSTAGDIESGEAVFTLSAVVTREGRVANLELVRANDLPTVTPGTDEARLVEDLMGAVSRARFEPASKAGSPIAVNMVWIVAHTTVRAKAGPMDLRTHPTSRKRTAQLSPAPPAFDDERTA